MKCTHPIYGLDLGVNPENGKRKIKILPLRSDLSSIKQLSARYGSDSIIPLPCGRCLACRLNKAKEWAVRCTLESTLYDTNYFVTLTYNDENYVDDGKKVLEDVKKFIKKLRYLSPGIRYFGCVERGSKNNRLHSHLILFNCANWQLKSQDVFQKVCDTTWKFGFTYVGEVTYQSCNYVARYSCKKVFHDCPDEKIFMSLKPGIGAEWFNRNYDAVLDDDCIYGKFGGSNVTKMPRYFEKIAEIIDSDRLNEIKTQRLDNSMAFTLNEMLIHGSTEQELLLNYKNQCLMDDYRQKGKRR